MTAESVFEMETSNRIQMANNTLLISLVQCWACNFPSEFWKRKKKSLKSHLASVWPWLSSRINDNCVSHMIAFAQWSLSAAITWAPLRIHQQFGLTREITIPIPSDRTNKRRARNRAAKQQEWNKKKYEMVVRIRSANEPIQWNRVSLYIRMLSGHDENRTQHNQLGINYKIQLCFSTSCLLLLLTGDGILFPPSLFFCDKRLHHYIIISIFVWVARSINNRKYLGIFQEIFHPIWEIFRGVLGSWSSMCHRWAHRTFVLNIRAL